jgi:hypothetical protein
MNYWITRVQISSAVRDSLIQNRDWGHKYVLNAYPSGVGPNPRATLGVLWYMDESSNTLLVQSAEAPSDPELLGKVISISEVLVPKEGERGTIRILTNCQKTPPSKVPAEARLAILDARHDEDMAGGARSNGKCYRSKPVVVPEEDRMDWAIGKLARIGFETDPENLTISNLITAHIDRRSKKIPAVSITARGTVRDAASFAQHVLDGLGKGKNYGLGLIRWSPDEVAV